MLTPKEKIILRGGSNPRRCVKQDGEPNTLPTSYSGPDTDSTWSITKQDFLQNLPSFTCVCRHARCERHVRLFTCLNLILHWMVLIYSNAVKLRQNHGNADRLDHIGLGIDLRTFCFIGFVVTLFWGKELAIFVTWSEKTLPGIKLYVFNLCSVHRQWNDQHQDREHQRKENKMSICFTFTQGFLL